MKKLYYLYDKDGYVTDTDHPQIPSLVVFESLKEAKLFQALWFEAFGEILKIERPRYES